MPCAQFENIHLSFPLSICLSVGAINYSCAGRKVVSSSTFSSKYLISEIQYLVRGEHVTYIIVTGW